MFATVGWCPGDVNYAPVACRFARYLLYPRAARLQNPFPNDRVAIPEGLLVQSSLTPSIEIDVPKHPRCPFSPGSSHWVTTDWLLTPRNWGQEGTWRWTCPTHQFNGAHYLSVTTQVLKVLCIWTKKDEMFLMHNNHWSSVADQRKETGIVILKAKRVLCFFDFKSWENKNFSNWISSWRKFLQDLGNLRWCILEQGKKDTF